MATAGAAAAAAAPETPVDGCLFLVDWEVARVQVHGFRREKAERELCDLQWRARGGSAALEAWSSVLESRRALEEAAARTAAQALAEVEARWKPLRIDAHDGEAAAWLLATERAHAEARAANAKRWAAAVPAALPGLVKRHKALVDCSCSSLPEALRAWHAAHTAAEHAWEHHSERLQATARAEAEGSAPPDSWLSEVRYRERARAELSQQAGAEQLLAGRRAELAALEAERTQLWESFAAAYTGTSTAAGGVGFAAEAAAVPPPPLRPPGACGDAPELAGAAASGAPRLPEMPSAGGAVLQRLRVAMQAPAGLFGLGGNGWREGATLVLTLHGYLHLFFSAEAATPDAKAAGQHGDEAEELVESAIKASVYVPMATKCMFLQKGKELVLEVAEPTEAVAAAPGPTASPGAAFTHPPPESPAAAGGAAAAAGSPAAGGPGLGGRAASGLRRLLGRPSGDEPLPRRVFAKVADVADFRGLEGRCQDFVRRGQKFRACQAASAV